MKQLYDVGYQSVDRDLLFAALKKLNAVLVDVRYSPRSRDAKWDGKKLAELLEDGYVHMPEFGNKNYKGNSIELASPEAGVLMLYQILAERPAILMCACWNRSWCHRAVAAKWFEDKYGVSSQGLKKSDLKALACEPEPEQLGFFEQPDLFGDV
jgi:uncharacterized protein (DUF488 family)